MRIAPGQRPALDEAARSSAPGHFVPLPHGLTHYDSAGPPDGQPVVLVPGFSVPFYVWDPTFAALAAAGFRVLRYDLYGRGYSDRPDVVYDLDLFDRQLQELLEAVGLGVPVDVCGVSMGGVIAAAFADRHPQQVRRLCLVDPAGLRRRVPLSGRLLQVPLLGELMMALFGDRMLLAGTAQDLTAPERFPEYVENYRPQMRYAGFKRALLSTMRTLLLRDMTDLYGRVGRGGHPVLVVWGREDRTVPLALSAELRRAMPRAQFHIIEGAGHVPHYERPEVVNPLLIAFLRG